MRVIEHRRHSMMPISSPHLNQKGVDLARKVGDTMGRFDYVITSTMPRTFETALAMGFAVNETLKELGPFSSSVTQEVSWNSGFKQIAQAFKNNGATTLWAKSLARIFVKIAHKVTESGSVLVISHGGIVEGSTIGCFPNFDFTSWDRSV
ncbi:MAG: histidine phosphatase family protein, partial [Candidatus Hodarchaeota archaeon]